MRATDWHLSDATAAAAAEALSTALVAGCADAAILFDTRGSIIHKTGNLPSTRSVDDIGIMLAAAWGAARARAKQLGDTTALANVVAAPGDQSYVQEGRHRGLVCLNVNARWLAAWLYPIPSPTHTSLLQLHRRAAAQTLASLAVQRTAPPAPSASSTRAPTPAPSSLVSELLEHDL